MVERKLPKLETGVRFPSSAPSNVDRKNQGYSIPRGLNVLTTLRPASKPDDEGTFDGDRLVHRSTFPLS
jgi:hypothetical protein